MSHGDAFVMFTWYYTQQWQLSHNYLTCFPHSLHGFCDVFLCFSDYSCVIRASKIRCPYYSYMPIPPSHLSKASLIVLSAYYVSFLLYPNNHLYLFALQAKKKRQTLSMLSGRPTVLAHSEKSMVWRRGWLLANSSFPFVQSVSHCFICVLCFVFVIPK